MSKVNISVNNKPFTIACDDGQEARVQSLGRYVDERYKELNGAGAAPNEAYMLVLTSLVMADEIFESRDQIAKQSAQPQMSQQDAARSAAMEGQIVQLQRALDQARAQLAQAQKQQAQAQSQAENVTNLEEVRAQMQREAEARINRALADKEEEVAKAVDSLTEQLEGVVKRLKRA